jgi:hypothetical protein
LVGQTINLTATAKTGFEFVGWQIKRGIGSFTTISTSASETYTILATDYATYGGDITFKAQFRGLPVTIELNTNLPYAGSISGPTSSYVGQTITINSLVNIGYRYDGWGFNNISGSVSYVPGGILSPTITYVIQPLDANNTIGFCAYFQPMNIVFSGAIYPLRQLMEQHTLLIKSPLQLKELGIIIMLLLQDLERIL